MNNFIIVGSVAFDAIETPFGKTDKILGGAATYISIAATYFNVKPKVISVVGSDFPEKHLKLFEKYKIDTEGIDIKEGRKTFFWSGKYKNDMNTRDTLVTELNVLGDFEPVVPKSYKPADVLMLGNLSPSVQSSVIKQLEIRPKLIVMDTMNFWMDTMLSELKNTISMVDVLSINDEEARQLSGEYSLKLAAEKILKMGPSCLIIKKGEHGALLFNDENMFFAPALPLKEVFDPTGAGDTFAGGFCGYLVKTNDFSFQNMKNAIIAGSALASFTCEKFGTEKLQEINSSMIYNRIQEFINLVNFDYPTNK